MLSKLGRRLLADGSLGLGQFGSCLGKQLAVMVGSRPGLDGPIRPPLPLLEGGRLLMGADRPLQGLDLMPSSLNDSLRIRRRRLVWSVAELLGSLVDLPRPLLELLGTLDHLLDLVPEFVTHGRLQAVAMW